MPNRETPFCLFCGKNIPPPESKLSEFGEVLCGRCDCGATYVCEPTGHNQGEALLDAMLLACPQGVENIHLGVNYELREKDYDYRTHKYIYLKSSPFQGRLFFIREIQGGVMAQREEKITVSKREFLKLLENQEFDTIEKISLSNRNTLGWIIGASYDRESLLSWKAIEAMGHVARVYVEAEQIEALRDTIRRLLWSMTEESGAVGWRAAELISEIVYAKPSLFEDIIPILWSHRQEESFLESVLRGVIKLARKVNLREHLKIEDSELKGLLEHENEEIRGLTSVLIERLNSSISVPEELKNSRISVYNNGKVIKIEASKAEKFL